MNNCNENGAQQQVGENAQSLVPYNAFSKEMELVSTAQRVVNKSKYKNKQLATQELARPNQKNTIMMDGFKCLICGSKTFMHMHMIPCMRESNTMSNYEVQAIPSRQRQICGAGIESTSSMEVAPYMTVGLTRRNSLCCVHCNIYFENEDQVLKHGHIVKFKSKYKIEEN